MSATEARRLLLMWALLDEHLIRHGSVESDRLRCHVDASLEPLRAALADAEAQAPRIEVAS